MKNKIYTTLSVIVLMAAMSGCLHAPARHQFGSYSDGEKFYAEGKYDKAIDSYTKYIDEHPEGNLTIIAKYYIAKSHVALNKSDVAKSEFLGITTQYPDLIWAELSREQIKNIDTSTASVKKS